MDHLNPWKQTTWYVFHTFTLKYLAEHHDQYKRFFQSFENIIPCEVCIKHYRYQLSRKDLSLEKNINAGDVNPLQNNYWIYCSGLFRCAIAFIFSSRDFFH